MKPILRRLQRSLDFFDGEPLGILELGVVIELDFLAVGQGLADGTDHEVVWVGPWLGGVYYDAADADAGLFPGLAADGFFEGLGGLAETGEGAVEVRGPAALAAEEEVGPGGVEDRHDHGGVWGILVGYAGKVGMRGVWYQFGGTGEVSLWACCQGQEECLQQCCGLPFGRHRAGARMAHHLETFGTPCRIEDMSA
jgi:hypothetical protein